VNAADDGDDDDDDDDDEDEDEDGEDENEDEPGPARGCQLESFRVFNGPGAYLFLAKARATSASTVSFRDLSMGEAKLEKKANDRCIKCPFLSATIQNMGLTVKAFDLRSNMVEAATRGEEGNK